MLISFWFEKIYSHPKDGQKAPNYHIAQVFQTPEVARVFVSSFWDEAYRFQDRRAPGGTSVLHRDTLGVIGSSNTWIVGVEKTYYPLVI